MENCEEAAVVIQEFEELIHTNWKKIIWVADHEGQTFERFKEKVKLELANRHSFSRLASQN